MTKLSVNVNKIATLRNSRGKNLPDLAQMTRFILGFGVHGITVHPRPDQRHIRREDVPILAELLNDWRKDHPAVEFNIEGYPSADYLKLIDETRPAQATLVPDPPDALTSNAGWRPDLHEDFLLATMDRLKQTDTRVSLFIDPKDLSDSLLKSLERIRPDRLELYTEAYADAFGSTKQGQVLSRYQKAATILHQMGFGLNAGHDLNAANLGPFIAAIPQIAEVSIGHAIVSEALYQGMAATLNTYLKILGWK